MRRLEAGSTRRGMVRVRSRASALTAGALLLPVLAGCGGGSPAQPVATTVSSLSPPTAPPTTTPGPDPFHDALTAFDQKVKGLNAGNAIKEQSDQLSTLRTQLQGNMAAVRAALKDTLAVRDRDDSDCSGIASAAAALSARANEANVTGGKTAQAANDLRVNSAKFGEDLTAALAQLKQLQDMAATMPVDDPGRSELSMLATTLSGLVRLRSTTTSPIDAALAETAPVASSVAAQVASGQRVSDNCYRRFSR